jgi:hypothetical protein
MVEKPAKGLAAGRAKSWLREEKGKKNSSKLNERSANVIENKGPLWKTSGHWVVSNRKQMT